MKNSKPIAFGLLRCARNDVRSLLITITTALMISCTPKTPVDTIVHNAKIYTVDDDFSMAEAFAVKPGIAADAPV